MSPRRAGTTASIAPSQSRSGHGRRGLVAVWPGGTANVLAQELGLPREDEAVADMIASGRTRQVSVGQAGQRHFLLMAGVGMDAAVVRDVNPRLKRLAGQGAFWIVWVQHLVRCAYGLQRPTMRDYVTLTGPTDGATAAGGR